MIVCTENFNYFDTGTLFMKSDELEDPYFKWRLFIYTRSLLSYRWFISRHMLEVKLINNLQVKECF